MSYITLKAAVITLTLANVSFASDTPPSTTKVRLFMGDQLSNPLIRYRTDLLQAALAQEGVNAVVVGCDKLSGRTSDRRSAIAVLDEHGCDVIATSAGGPLTRAMTVVPFPIYLGGGGYRVLLMTPGRVQRLAATPLDLSALRRLKIGSGTSWADTAVLEYNKIPVERAPMYEQLFDMLKAERFDALSRSIFEVEGELKSIASEGIALEQNTLVHYATDLFFYVAPTNDSLRDKLERGLKKMYCAGRMHQFLRNHPSTRSMWVVVRPETRHAIGLESTGFVPPIEANAMSLYGDGWRQLRPTPSLCVMHGHR